VELVVITAAGKAGEGGRVQVLIVGLTPGDLDRLRRGGGITREFREIDPTLGDGVLMVAGVPDQETFLVELKKRFEVVREVVDRG
jgi:hypothetical protein